MVKKKQAKRMTLKKIPVRKAEKKAIASKIPRRADTLSLEEETIRRSTRTLATLEGFLTRWDSSRVKPQGMAPEINRIKRFYEGLSRWQKSALKARTRKEDDKARVRRLRDFVLLCRSYSS